MIDGIKLECNYLQPETWLQNELITFAIPVNNHTGEVIRDTIKAKRNGLTFKITPSHNNPDVSYCNIEGSLHKYKNDGAHNANDFTDIQLNEVIQDLAEKFSIDPEKSIIKNLEFGVNVYLPIKATDFLKMVISTPDKRFSDLNIEKIKIGKVCRKTEYEAKVYNKGKQTGSPIDNLVRIELKVLKMRWLQKQANIKTLSDLRNPENLQKLLSILIESFSNVIIYDNSINFKLLSTREKLLMKDFRNPNYWELLTFRQRHKKTKQFKSIIIKYDLNKIRAEIIDIIRKKGSELITSFIPKTTPEIEPLAAHKKEMFSPLECRVKPSPETHKNITLNEGLKKLPEKRFCKICGLDISNRRPGAKHCCKKCRNKASGQARTERNRLKRQKEALQLNKILLLDRTTLKTVTFTTNDRKRHRRQISKLHLTPAQIKKVVFVKIAGFEFTTLRAKAVIKYLLTKL